MIGVLAGDAKIGAGTTELQVFRPIHAGVLSAYVYLFLRSPMFTVEGERSMTGTAGQKRVPTEYFATRAFPLPPTEEQSRIVAKVDELMALCDQLEVQQQARRKIQNTLRQSILQAVANAQSSHEVQGSWQRLQDNFGRLFAESGDVKDFKGLILDLAVSGLLLPTSGKTTSAEDLIQKIANARTEWAKTAKEQEKKEAVAMLKKLRTQQLAVPTSSLPEHWSWATLLQVAQVVVDCHNKTAPYVAEGVHLVRTSDIREFWSAPSVALLSANRLDTDFFNIDRICCPVPHSPQGDAIRPRESLFRRGAIPVVVRRVFSIASAAARAGH